MNNQLRTVAFSAAVLASALIGAAPAVAQVAGGSTTIGVSVTESTQLALGWSVKKTLLGKTVYNDAGQKVGKVQDLIIAPDRNVSYVIVGAGGFIGMGRHDVAVPIAQMQDKAGKLVMAGATKDSIQAMPAFAYATEGAARDRFVAAADKDIARGKAKVLELEKQAGVAGSDVRAKIDLQIISVKAEVKAADAQLDEMKHAAAARWKEFEAGVSAATARVRKAVDVAIG